jgi:spore photoproduct lyase
MGNKLNCKLLLDEKRKIIPINIDYDILNSIDFRYSLEKQFPIDKIKDGSIIKLFDKTPKPEKLTDVVCPHFYELKWANGCNFNCAWCYLNGTYRFLKRGKKPHLKDINKILNHLDCFFNDVHSERFILNSGELSDSLLFENNGAPLTKKIIPKFMSQNKHKLLILTKSDKVDNLLKINATEHVIASFSLNSFKVAELWEKAPRIKDRIKAAQKLYNLGYIVRVRIDPMVPIKNWKKEYTSLIDNIFDRLTPERITLGSLRGLQSTINNSKDLSWTKYLTETSNWGKKVDTGHRFTMYSAIINHLRSNFDYNDVALCKETIDIWNKLNLDYSKIKCNCIL